MRHHLRGIIIALLVLGALSSATAAFAAPAGLTAGIEEIPPVNAGLLATMFGVQLPLMIGLPILLGWFIRRRYGIGWGVFALGALTFVLSQVVHLPLNAALGLLGGGRGVALWPLVPMALVAGLSAGICEEGARLLVLLFLARHVRGWRAGLQYGAGHGGIEAIIFGLLAAVNVVSLLATRSMGSLTQSLPPDALEQMRAAQAAFWSTSPLLPLVGGLERVFAITLQIAMAVLVVRAVTHRQPIFFLAAIALHTLIDFWAVVGVSKFGIFPTEALLAVMALGGAWIIWRLREEPQAPSPVSEDEVRDILSTEQLQPQSLSSEELARRAEQSRYE